MNAASHEKESDDRFDARDRAPSPGAGILFILAVFVLVELLSVAVFITFIAWIAR